jgi:phenylpropionate dioxygenase-like ring-hydroxylating dioxygenase large terminal subunit
VEWSSKLANGDVKTLHFFDRELVAYRTEGGIARVIDAFCPHLGAHIGYGGSVKGEILQCPWHGWEWDLDGKNVHIPFVDRVHPRAKLGAWAVRETDGLIIVWYDSLGSDPSWEFPGIPEFSDRLGFYEPFEELVGPAALNPQQPRENTADLYHFPFVHGTGQPVELDEMEARGHILHERSRIIFGGGKATTWLTPNGPMPGRIESNIYGLGIGLDRMEIDDHLRTVQTVCVTPVDKEGSLFFSTTTATRAPEGTAGETRNRRMMESQASQIMNDFKVWTHQKYVTRPNYSDQREARFFHRFRSWANQFYPADVGVEIDPGDEVSAAVEVSGQSQQLAST